MPSSIRDRREADITALRRGVTRTLDPARGSSSACAPSLSSSSSKGNRGHDLRRRSVTVGIMPAGASSSGPPNDARFTVVVGSGFRIFLLRPGMRQIKKIYWAAAADRYVLSFGSA